MEKKKSSIDWFITEFQKQIEFVPNSELDIWFKNLFPQAKQMHKNEIIVAFYEGIEQESNEHGTMYLDKTEAEEYYNETFGGNNE